MIVLHLTFRRRSLSVTLTLTDVSFSALIQFEMMKSLFEKFWGFWSLKHLKCLRRTFYRSRVCLCCVESWSDRMCLMIYVWLTERLTSCRWIFNRVYTLSSDESKVLVQWRQGVALRLHNNQLLNLLFPIVLMVPVFLVVLLNGSVFTGLQREPLSVCHFEKLLLHFLTSCYFVKP